MSELTPSDHPKLTLHLHHYCLGHRCFSHATDTNTVPQIVFQALHGKGADGWTWTNEKTGATK